MTNSAAYKAKEQELQAILKRLSDWQPDHEQAIEKAMALLEENQQSLETLDKLDSLMSSDELILFSKENHHSLQAMILKQKELIQFIKEQSNQLTRQLGQMNHKSKAVKLYMNNETSLFIDRDM